MNPEDNFNKGEYAVIRDAYFSCDAYGSFICGKIYNDTTGSFKDGENFITSYIYAKLDNNAWLSRNGMTYFVVMKEKEDEVGIRR